MRQLLNTLFVTSEDVYLSLDGENVVANREGEIVARYPLHTLQSIVSFSYAGASPALMGACAQREIGLAFCSPRGRFLARITGPLRGATLQGSRGDGILVISIHAPLTGRDRRGSPAAGRGAISIHAPLTGRDAAMAKKFNEAIQFQSTRPLRGATAKIHKKSPRIFATTDKTQDNLDRTPPVKVSRPMGILQKQRDFRCEPRRKTLYASSSHYTISVSSGK